MERTPFQDELATLINRHSLENGSNTPDFLLADFLCDCLATWESAVEKREKWYGRTTGATAAPFSGIADDCGCDPGAVSACTKTPCPRKTFDGPNGSITYVDPTSR